MADNNMGGGHLRTCTLPECVIVEIGMQMHSNCMKNKLFIMKQMKLLEFQK